jgi:hypothetical protein
LIITGCDVDEAASVRGRQGPVEETLVDELLISISTDQASDSWGFVGVVKVGEFEAYRTLNAFSTPGDALAAAQALMGGILGEWLAGSEWRQLHEATGRAPTRQDLNLGVLGRHAPSKAGD